MKTRLFVLAAFVAVFAAIAQGPMMLPVWTGQSYVFPKLGSTLKIANGVIDAAITARRHVDVALTFDSTAGGWILPAAAPGFAIANIAIYANGLRYHAGVDFGIDFSNKDGIVKGVSGIMDPSFFVTCDYDEQ